MKSLGQHKISVLENNGTVILSLDNGLTVVVENSGTAVEVSISDRHNKKIVNSAHVSCSQSFSLFRNYVQGLISDHVLVDLPLDWVEKQFKRYYVKNDDVVNVEDYFIDNPFDISLLIPFKGNLSDYTSDNTDLVRPFYRISDKDHFDLQTSSFSLFKTPNGKIVTVGNVLLGGDLVESGALLPVKEEMAKMILDDFGWN